MTETDALADLYSMITSGWTLTDTDLSSIGNKQAVPAKKVHCSTGWYDAALQSPQITITPVSGIENYADVGYSHFGERELFDIGVWVQIDRSTAKGEGYAKTKLYKLREEIKRIVRLKHGGSGNIGHIDLIDWRFAAESEVDAPLLHYVFTVACETYKARSDS